MQHTFLASFAETFSAEADELRLRTRRFDAQSFIAFVAAWGLPGQLFERTFRSLIRVHAQKKQP